jgi:hypothetical protein
MPPIRAAAALLVSAVLVQGLAAMQGRPGATRVSGHALRDDAGEFAALGASLFWAAWAYRHDRPRLDAALARLSEHRFDYIRALGVVGRQPYWAGREIDWRWPDYDAVIAGLTDHAYDRYGLRVQWTIFADADQVIPDAADRVRLLDRFVEMSRGREHKIIHFELANESWQNGFGGADGIAQLRELTRRLASRTQIPVAISDSEGHDCEDHLVLYRDLDVEIVTEHFARDVGGPLGSWAPALEAWRLRECAGLPAVRSSNEPIGPRSSVASEENPTRIIGAALAAYLSGVGLYVFHTDAGVWGREPLEAMPNAGAMLGALRAMKGYLPPDIANWQSHRHGDPGHPFVLFAGEARDATRVAGQADGAVEMLASVHGDWFVAVPLGIVDGLTIEARGAMRFAVIDPLTGEQIDAHELRAGEKVRLPELPVLVLKGESLTGPSP